VVDGSFPRIMIQRYLDIADLEKFLRFSKDLPKPS